MCTCGDEAGLSAPLCAPDQKRHWVAHADATVLYAAVAARTLADAEAAIEARGRFVLVLAGGNTPRGVYQLLRTSTGDWSRWHIFFGDERCTPVHDPARNSGMAGAAWLDHVAIPAGQLHRIPGELGARAAAAAYAGTVAAEPLFDLVLLGLGEDGHTASLFPGHALGWEAASPPTLAVFAAPKPPPERVSLSAHRLSAARAALYMVTGTEKVDAVQRWRRGEQIPARFVTPPSGVAIHVEQALLDAARDGASLASRQ